MAKRRQKAKVPEVKPTGIEPVCSTCTAAAATTGIEVVPPLEEPAPIEEVTPVKSNEVPVESVPDGGIFEFKGKLYKKRKQVYSGQVVARLVVGTNADTVRATGSAEFRPGVKVILK